MTLVHDPRTRKIFQTPAIAANKRNRNEDADRRAQQRNEIRHLCPPARPGKMERPNLRYQLFRLRLPFQSAQGRRRINLTAHGYFGVAPDGHSSGWRALITMASELDRPPSRPEYRVRKDDIVPIASTSATPAHHSRSKSPLRKSKSKPRQPTSGMFPRLPERSSRAHFIFSVCRLQARHR